MANQDGIIHFTCGKCGEQTTIDVSAFHPRHIVTQSIHCRNGHKNTAKVRQGKIIEIETGETGNIGEYVDVPSHIKEIITEAYVCLGEGAPKAGTCAIRLVLDDFLFELGCEADRPSEKVEQLESKCQRGSDFEMERRTICRRIDVFKTIAGLAGYHVHAQRHITDVVESEFSNYLRTVEGAVKDLWPIRSGR